MDGLARQAVTHRELYAVVLQDVTAAELRRGTPSHDAVFRELRDVLAGPAGDPESVIRASVFLSRLMGPAVDPDVRRLDADTIERAIAAVGRRLLGLPH